MWRAVQPRLSAESGFWKTIWRARLSSVGRLLDLAARACSSSSIVPPASGPSMPRIVRARVDLPEPDSPTSPRVSPSRSSEVDARPAPARRGRSGGRSSTRLRRPARRRRGSVSAPTIDGGSTISPSLSMWWQRDHWPSPTSTTGGTTVRHSSSASWQRSTKTQVGRSVPICGRLPGIVDSARSDLRTPRRGSERSRPSVYGCFGIGEDGRRVTFLDDLAGVHHADPIAQRPDDAEVVGDQQDRRVRLGLERAHEVEDARLDRGVEAGRRFVEDQQLRVGGERDGDDDALLHPAGQLVRVAVGDAPPGRRSARARAPACALSLACLQLWPRIVNASATCGPILVDGFRAAPGSW